MSSTLQHTAPPGVVLQSTDVHSHLDEEVKAAVNHVDQVETNPKDLDELTNALANIPRSAFADQTPSQAIRTFKRQFFLGALASVGALYIGYCFNAVGNIVANPGFIEQFGKEINGEMALVAKDVSAWGAVQQCGQIFTQFTSPWIIDRYGRKSVMYALAILIAISSICALVAKDWRIYLLAKLFAGMGCGCLGPAVLTYMSEVSRPNYRGILLSTFSWMMSIGGFVNAVACQIVIKTAPMEYRHIFYSEYVFLGIWIAAVLVIPESHLWYISRGEIEKAKRAHRRLVGNVEGYNHEAEFAILQKEVEISEAITAAYSGNSWFALLFKRDNILRAVIASLPFAAQQFSGVPYTFNYATYFFQLGGLADPFLGNVIINVVYIIFVFASFFLVDRIGRRPLVVYGLAALGIWNIAIGGLGWLDRGSAASGGALITFCCLWMMTYALTLAPIGWVGVVEVSSSKLRAKTAAFAVLVNSIIGLVFNYTVPLLLSDQGAGWNIKVGLFFGGLSFLFLIPCYYLYPETQGRSYAEIDELFQRRIPSRQFAKTKTSHQEQAERGAV